MKPILNLVIKSNLIEYPIWLGDNLFNKISLPRRFFHVVIITDKTVNKLYANAIEKYLKSYASTIAVITIPPGEQFKQAATKAKIENQLFKLKCQRDTLIVALGGGVIGDLAGFTAATYMRGVPYLHIPTTLLAMVDSSIGGKTGINTAFGKNSLGAIWHPLKVIIDIHTLKTLPHKHVLNGLSEVLKIFVTHERASFLYFKKNIEAIKQLKKSTLLSIVKRAIKLKAQIVSQDEREEHVRATLNFGHTIGHAIEKVTNYEILHGFAVAAGMLVEMKIAECLGHLPENIFRKFEEVLLALNIPIPKFRNTIRHKIYLATFNDKKNKLNQPHYVIMKNIGCVFVKNNCWTHAVPSSIVKTALEQVLG